MEKAPFFAFIGSGFSLFSGQDKTNVVANKCSIMRRCVEVAIFPGGDDPASLRRCR